MGNCLETLSHPQQERRLQNWKSTGVVGLRDSRLRSVPDSAIGLGDAIKIIDISSNNITSLSPSLAALTNLQRLVAAGNRLTSFPAALCCFPSLKILVLDSNQLHELPEEVCQLLKLEKLSVSSNQLKALPASIGRLKDLKSLSAASNHLSGLPEELSACSSLQELELQGNSIDSIPASLGLLAKLRTINLDNNQVTSVPAEVLQGCLALQTLSLHGNPIVPAQLQETPGFEAYEARRRRKLDKAITGNVLLNSNGLDEGVDRPTSPKK